MRLAKSSFRDRHAVLMVMYDLPVKRKDDMKSSGEFRKFLIRSGFLSLQKSVYVKLLRNGAGAATEEEKLRVAAPHNGTVHVLTLPLRTFRCMLTLAGPEFNMEVFGDDLVWILKDEEDEEKG